MPSSYVGIIGRTLRQAREQKGVTLAEAQQATKIRQAFLQALEEENYIVLPPPVYIRGFLKNYSGYLGLDSMAMVQSFDELLEAVAMGLDPYAGSTDSGSADSGSADSGSADSGGRGFLMATIPATPVEVVVENKPEELAETVEILAVQPITTAKNLEIETTHKLELPLAGEPQSEVIADKLEPVSEETKAEVKTRKRRRSRKRAITPVSETETSQEEKPVEAVAEVVVEADVISETEVVTEKLTIETEPPVVEVKPVEENPLPVETVPEVVVESKPVPTSLVRTRALMAMRPANPTIKALRQPDKYVLKPAIPPLTKPAFYIPNFMPLLAVLIIVAAALLLVYRGVALPSTNERLAATATPNVYSAPTVTPISGTPGKATNSGPQPVVTTVSGSPQTSVAPDPTIVASIAQGSASQTSQIVTTAPPTAPPALQPVKVQLVVSADSSWVQVWVDDKAVLNELVKGKTLVYEGKEKVEIALGKPGAVKILVNGQEKQYAPPNSGAVIKGFKADGTETMTSGSR
jgi:cytoskeletal protein RodZ